MKEWLWWITSTAVALSTIGAPEVFSADQSLPTKSRAPITIQVMTLCVANKTAKPPDDTCKYRVGGYPDPVKLAKFGRIYETAKRLEKKGDFAAVPINPQRRVGTIAQLAVWKMQGEESSNPKDAVTREGIGEDLLTSTNTAKSSLSKSQQEAFEEGVDKIFEATNFTLKNSDEVISSNEKGPKKPDASAGPKPDEPSLCSTLDNTICGDISDRVEQGQLSAKLIGDGASTAHVQLELVNLTDRPMLVLIPEGLVFSPGCEGYQYMWVRENTAALLPPGKDASDSAGKTSGNIQNDLFAGVCTLALNRRYVRSIASNPLSNGV